MRAAGLSLLLLLVLVGGSGTPTVFAAPTASQKADLPAVVDVHLLAFNDFHGHLDPSGAVQVPTADGGVAWVPSGGAAWLAAALQARAAREPLHVIVAAGDLVGASPFVSAHFHDEPTIDALNHMGLEFSAPGNHEFDRGVEELKRLQNGGCIDGDDRSCAGGHFDGAKFRYLAANVTDRDGKPLFPASAVKTFEVDGRSVRIGFIGLDTVTTASISAQGAKSARFSDEATAANAEAARLRKQGVRTTVVLIHQGGSSSGSYNDSNCPDFAGDILPILDRLDADLKVIVSGHTHQVYNCRRNGRLVTSAGAYGHYLTDIDLQIDPVSGQLLAANAENIVVVNDTGKPGAAKVAGYPPLAADPAMSALVAAADARAAPLAGRIVAQIAAPISRAANDAGEMPLGDLIADSELAAARNGGAQLALMNSGGVRDDLREPAVSYADAFAVQPFGDDLVSLTLTGAQLREVLDEGLSSERARPLQVSGNFSYAWSASKPAGSRVVADSLRLDGKAVAPDARLRIVVNDYMAAGGDGLRVLKAGRQAVPGGLALDAMIDYLAANKPEPPPPGRIQREP